ncbi:PCYCGC domain-containing protein [Patescibacteria group bacterium]|nr:PCYCGC domain-containing protein [Patescibacteria group bacterium]
MKNSYLGITLILIAGGLLAGSYFWQNKGQERSNLPQYATRTASVQAAYQHALDNPELLQYIPCYCNCYQLGHKNVDECFIKEFKPDGKVVFDEHGANCGICYATVLDSQLLFDQGKTIQEIREYVDNKYSSYGQGTNTPLP